jgi:hypothetical protein
MGDLQGEKAEQKPEYSTLDTLIEDEIYKKPAKGIFQKAKRGIERFFVNYGNAAAITAGVVAGGLTAWGATKSQENMTFLVQQLGVTMETNPLKPLLYGVLGAAASWKIAGYLVKEHMGKKILGFGEGKKLKKLNENFIYSSRLELAKPLCYGLLGILAIRQYQTFQQLNLPLEKYIEVINQNFSRTAIQAGALAAVGFAASFFMVDQLGKFFSLRNLDYWKADTGYVLRHLSPKIAIAYLEKQSRKGNVYADERLSHMEGKGDKKFELRRKVIDNIKRVSLSHREGVNWLKKFSLGGDFYEFKKNPEISLVLDIAMRAYSTNPSFAVGIVNRLADAVDPNTGLQVLVTRNYFLNRNGKDTGNHWEEFFEEAERRGALQLLPSTEGEVPFYKDDDYIRMFILPKTYHKDFDEKAIKFFTEYFIWQKAQGTTVKVEQPLIYYDVPEKSLQRHIIVRAGLENLTESLQGKSADDRRALMKEMLPRILAFQELVYSALEREGSEHVINADFRGESRRIIVPRLDLLGSLEQRAFYGYGEGNERLGVNEYLPALIKKMRGIFADKYHPILETALHNDMYGGRNVMPDGTFIDSRLRMGDTPNDPVSFILGPEFLSTNFASRKEDVLEALLAKENIRAKEKFLSNTFDALYLAHASSLSGSRFYYGFAEEAELLVNEWIEFANTNGFLPELKPYLKKSNAGKLYAVKSL